MTQDYRARPFRWQVDYQVGDKLPLFGRPHYQWRLETDYIGRRLVYRPATESTLDDARHLLDRMEMPHGAIILAESQSAGRGRAGRAWVSPPDVNLYLTLILFPEAALLRALAYLTPLAVALAVEEVAAGAGAPIEVDLKWPNDVQVSGKKLARVLIEMETAERTVALVGVGINVNLDPVAYPEIAAIATSVRDAVGFDVSREEVLAAFCNRFEALYEQVIAGSREPFEQWRARLVTLGKRVVAHGLPGRPEGTASDVHADGGLILRLDDGRELTIDAGDVEPRD